MCVEKLRKNALFVERKAAAKCLRRSLLKREGKSFARIFPVSMRNDFRNLFSSRKFAIQIEKGEWNLFHLREF